MKKYFVEVVANWLIFFSLRNLLVPFASDVFQNGRGGAERRIFIFGVRVIQWQLYKV